MSKFTLLITAAIVKTLINGVIYDIHGDALNTLGSSRVTCNTFR